MWFCPPRLGAAFHFIFSSDVEFTAYLRVANPQRTIFNLRRTFDTATVETWHTRLTLYRATSHPCLRAQASDLPSPLSRYLLDNAKDRPDLRYTLHKTPSTRLFNDVVLDPLHRAVVSSSGVIGAHRQDRVAATHCECTVEHLCPWFAIVRKRRSGSQASLVNPHTRPAQARQYWNQP